MGRRKPKTPLSKGSLSKSPVALPPSRDFHRDKLVVSFEHADRTYSGEWGWPEDHEAHQVLRFLCDMSALTWAEIRAQTWSTNRATHMKHHDMPVAQLCQEARRRLAERHLDEIIDEQIFRFRLTGPARLWGFVVDGIFHVLWWDPNHKVYPLD